MSAPEGEKARLSPGDSVGRYRVRGHLADGEAGAIYLAELTGPGSRRKVALRVIHPDKKKDDELCWTFIDETRRALRLHHPNVVQTLDLIRTDEHLGAALEYAPGLPVLSLYPKGALELEVTPDLVAYIGAEAAAGLFHAHTLKDSKGAPLAVVHGDVCPSNVRIGFDGRIRVADFGMARALERLGKVSAPHGTFAYSAPEQVAGEELDGRADVWGLGVVLWELLARYRLFRRDTEEETATAVKEAEVPPLDEVREDVPDAIESAIRRALERDPAKRWQSAKEMQQALRNALPRNLEPIRRPLLEALKSHREKYVEQHSEILGNDARSIPSLGLALSKGAAKAAPTGAKPYLRSAAPATSGLFAKRVAAAVPEEAEAAEEEPSGKDPEKKGEAKKEKPAEKAGPPLPPPILPPIPKKKKPAPEEGVEVDVEVPSLPSGELKSAPPGDDEAAVPPMPPPPGASPQVRAPPPAPPLDAEAKRKRTLMLAGGAALFLVVLLVIVFSGNGEDAEPSDEGQDTSEERTKAAKKAPEKVAKAPQKTAPDTAEPETAEPAPTANLRIESNRVGAWVEIDGGERRELPVELTGLEPGKELQIRAGGDGYRERTMKAVVGDEPVFTVYLNRVSSGGSRPRTGQPRTARPPPKKGLASNPFGG